MHHYIKWKTPTVKKKTNDKFDIFGKEKQGLWMKFSLLGFVVLAWLCECWKHEATG